METGLQVLIVRSSDGTAWVLPKGHLEAGESSAVAAEREVREETGVVARIGRLLATQELPNGPVVDYFAGWALRNVRPTEMREVRWVSADEADQLLSFPEARKVVSMAVEDPIHG